MHNNPFLYAPFALIIATSLHSMDSNSSVTASEVPMALVLYKNIHRLRVTYDMNNTIRDLKNNIKKAIEESTEMQNSEKPNKNETLSYTFSDEIGLNSKDYPNTTKLREFGKATVVRVYAVYAKKY